jgi:hypothetical protein
MIEKFSLCENPPSLKELTADIAMVKSCDAIKRYAARLVCRADLTGLSAFRHRV